MGEEGKAWTSLYHCSLLEKVQLKIKETQKPLYLTGHFPDILHHCGVSTAKHSELWTTQSLLLFC